MHALVLALAFGWHYFCGHIAGFLAASLIPTVLAGLMSKPNADSSKLVIGLKAALKFCGWAMHFDEPGSVKLPMQELIMPALKWAAKRAGLVTLFVVLVSASVSGCATVASNPGDTTGQKFATDVAALKGIAEDVKAQCGPQYVSLAPLLASALAVAADPYNVMGDAMAIAQSYATVAADIKALECVVKVVQADVKALKPKAPVLPPPTEATGAAL